MGIASLHPSYGCGAKILVIDFDNLYYSQRSYENRRSNAHDGRSARSRRPSGRKRQPTPLQARHRQAARRFRHGARRPQTRPDRARARRFHGPRDLLRGADRSVQAASHRLEDAAKNEPVASIRDADLTCAVDAHLGDEQIAQRIRDEHYDGCSPGPFIGGAGRDGSFPAASPYHATRHGRR